jgi:Tfp pilus assembly protein FimT
MALLDLIFTCALILVMAAIAIPSLHASRERDAAVMAARHLATRLSLLRVDALRRNRIVAVRFDPDDIGLFRIYADGDGDGISQQDIDADFDPPLEPDTHISDLFELVAFHVPISIPAPEGSGVIAAESDPVRIGNSNFLSFSPVGTATSGTVYLAGRGGTQMCVRVFGGTGRVRVLRFDRAAGAWRQD